jgi:ubiquinone/menaquinone biosynthesis C-methylase UbiE
MLSNVQYASSEKYEARIYLNTKFRTSAGSKFRWIFDHFFEGDNLNVLELGCGTGLFWLANRNEIPPGWNITLTDYSEGMLKTTRRTLSQIRREFRYEVMDAGNITYPDRHFDIILANNMLYHIENRAAAISHIARILKDSGRFYASTMGKNDMLELNRILYDFLGTRGKKFTFREFSFSLENGEEQLKASFPSVTLSRFHDTLRINEAEAVINYYLSFNGMYDGITVLADEDVDPFRKHLQGIIDREQFINVTKDSGVFICSRLL